jgi:hypothetical protein
MSHYDKEREEELEQIKRWPESEERIDIIGQNGNTGDHYEILDNEKAESNAKSD